MLAEKNEIDKLNGKIISGEIQSIEKLQSALNILYNSYETKAWSWCVALLKSWKDIDVSSLTKELLLQLIDEWKTSRIKLNNMVLKDAEKEFDQHSQIGFGIDGETEEIQQDFENIRGAYSTNKFVMSLKDEIEKIEKRAAELKSQIAKL